MDWQTPPPPQIRFFVLVRFPLAYLLDELFRACLVFNKEPLQHLPHFPHLHQFPFRTFCTFINSPFAPFAHSLASLWFVLILLILSRNLCFSVNWWFCFVFHGIRRIWIAFSVDEWYFWIISSIFCWLIQLINRLMTISWPMCTIN